MTPHRVRVHARYPDDLRRTEGDDTSWLADTVRLHHNQLVGGVMESFPAQHYAGFETDADAWAFVDHLNGSGRWRASIEM